MANSANYTATKEDARVWRSDHDSRANTKDEAAVDHATAIQTRTRSSNPVTAISVLPATVTLDLSEEETAQITLESTTPANKGVSLTYSSSDEDKATVSPTGLITPVAAGSATITVSCVHNTSVTDTVVVTVEA